MVKRSNLRKVSHQSIVFLLIMSVLLMQAMTVAASNGAVIITGP